MENVYVKEDNECEAIDGLVNFTDGSEDQLIEEKKPISKLLSVNVTDSSQEKYELSDELKIEPTFFEECYESESNFKTYIKKETDISELEQEFEEEKIDVLTNFKEEEIDVFANLEENSENVIKYNQKVENSTLTLQNDSKSKLNKEYLLHSIEGNSTDKFTCTICMKTFLLKDSFERHCFLHSQNKYFNCNVCKKSFSSKYLLQQHRLIHPKDKAMKLTECFKCGHCNSSFECLSELEEHSKLHLQNFDKKDFYNCQMCDKRFKRSTLLELIYECKNSEKPYSCTLCRKSYKKIHYLDRHLKSHIKVPNTIDNCRNSYELHTKLHQYKPYLCKPCQKQFTSRTKEQSSKYSYSVSFRDQRLKINQKPRIKTEGSFMKTECSIKDNFTD